MTLSEIIKNYRTENDLTMQELADRCKLSKAYISMLENKFKPTGRKKDIVPSIQAIKKLSNGTGLDFDFLLSSIDGEISLVPTKEDNIITEVKIEYNDYFPLHYNTNLSAGTLEELLDSEPDAVVYVPIKYQMKKNRLYAFKVNGTSMNNVIPDKSIVIVESIDTLNSIKDGTIVVAWVDGNATVKRLYVNDNQITLMPDSTDKSHLPIMIDTDINTVIVIGRVIWHMNPDDISKTY